jgi:hypothetical protein
MIISASADTAFSHTYQHDGYEIVYNVCDAQESYQNIGITITNMSDAPIENWALTYDSGGDIENPWNSCVSAIGDLTYLNNAGYNADISPNSSVHIGYILKNAPMGYIPADISFCQTRETVDTSRYSVLLNVLNDWASDFSGAFTIENLSDSPIYNPELSFSCNLIISNSWAFDITYFDETLGKYSIKAKNNYSYISPHSSISLSFNGTKIPDLGDSGDVSPGISGGFTLTEVIVKNALTIGESDFSADTDGDILPDLYEDFLHTDKHNPDTDNDGLPDGYEVFNGLNPNVFDCYEDFDYDGLTNVQEFTYGTSPCNKDTDNDDISDYDEVFTYLTNPTESDSDLDTMSDWSEILLGLDPLAFDTDGNGISDGDEILEQTITPKDTQDKQITPSAEITGAGDFRTRITIQDVSLNKAVSDLPFIIGEPYDFSHQGNLNFQQSTLTFDISDDILQNHDITNLSIAYFNTSNGRLELLSTYVSDNHTISTDVDHYSIYLVVDKVRYLLTAHSSSDYADITVNNDYKTISGAFNGHFYAFIDDVKTMGISWTGAEKFCENLGGHLAVITSKTSKIL